MILPNLIKQLDFDESDIIPSSITHDDIENYLSNEENISLILEND